MSLTEETKLNYLFKLRELIYERYDSMSAAGIRVAMSDCRIESINRIDNSILDILTGEQKKTVRYEDQSCEVETTPVKSDISSVLPSKLIEDYSRTGYTCSVCGNSYLGTGSHYCPGPQKLQGTVAFDKVTEMRN